MATQNATNNASLPYMVDIDVFGTPKSDVGTWANATSSSVIFNATHQNTSSAQNDEIIWDVTLAPGTWTVEVMGTTADNRAIIHIEIDGVEEGTVDYYSASPAQNTLKSVTGVSISDAGVHELTLKAGTKNASSTSYLVTVNGIRLIRTGA